MTVSGGFQDKCPTQGCGTNLSHLITDAHRAGHATTKLIRTEPEPPMTAAGVAAVVAEALKAAGVGVGGQPAAPTPKPQEAELRATVHNASGEALGFYGIDPVPARPQRGNVYPHPNPKIWDSSDMPSETFSTLADLLHQAIVVRIRANTAEANALQAIRKQLEQVL